MLITYLYCIIEKERFIMWGANYQVLSIYHRMLEWTSPYLQEHIFRSLAAVDFEASTGLYEAEGLLVAPCSDTPEVSGQDKIFNGSVTHFHLQMY